MIHIRQRIVERSRTHTSSRWEATAEIGGKTYSATSRHGAPQALARVLVAAGIVEQPVEVRSEVCVFDNGAEIRTEELRGCIRNRSLHAMAEATFQEGDRPLHRARFKELPQIAFPLQPCEQGMRFTPPASILGSEDREPQETERTPEVAPRCEGCGNELVLQRVWSRFCSPSCRLRAWRAGRAKAGTSTPARQAPAP
jgi:hypothetical protein